MLDRYLFWIMIFFAAALVAGCGVSKKNLNSSEVHYTLGLSYLGENNPTRALNEFLIAEEADPANAEIQAALAQAYHLKKAYPEAERHYLRALQLTANDPQFLNNLGALYLDMERWDEAIRTFDQAASNLLFTRSEVALTGKGFAYFKKGNFLEAVTAFKKALVKNPNFTQARFRLAETYYVLDNPDLAIDEYRKILVITPDYPLAHYKLALAYVKNRQKDKALSSFREVIRLAPDSEWGKLSTDYLGILK